MHRKFLRLYFIPLLLLFGLCSCRRSNLDWDDDSEKEFTQLKLKEKFRRLNKTFSTESIIQIVSEFDFQNLLIKQPKNYSVVLLLTSTKCEACRKTFSELRTVARRYVKRLESHPPAILFAELNYENQTKLFRKINRKISVPYLYYMNADGGRLKDLVRMDIQDFDQRSISHWLKNVAGETEIEELRQEGTTNEDYLLIFLSVAMLLHTLFRRKEKWLNMSNSEIRDVVASILIFLITALTSGQSFNHIAGPPLIAQGEYDEWIFVYPATHSQLVVESLIILVLSLGCVIGFILMLDYKSKDEAWWCGQSKPNVGVLVFLASFYIINLISGYKLRYGKWAWI